MYIYIVCNKNDNKLVFNLSVENTFIDFGRDIYRVLDPSDIPLQKQLVFSTGRLNTPLFLLLYHVFSHIHSCIYGNINSCLFAVSCTFIRFLINNCLYIFSIQDGSTRSSPIRFDPPMLDFHEQ